MLRRFAVLAVSGILSLGVTTLQAQPASACLIATCGGVAGSLLGPGWDQGDNGYISWNASFAGIIHGDPQVSTVAYISGGLSGGVGTVNLFAYNFMGASYYASADAQRTAIGPVVILALTRGGVPVGTLTQVTGVPQAFGVLVDATG